jgi:hypothetical protein
MDAEQILEGLAERGRLPVEAIRAADANRASAVPGFVRAIEQYDPSDESASPDALFMAFHLLGSWREKAAYRPLARLLRRPSDVVERILGGAITETSHRVMAGVFDGDPGPLYQIILDQDADEFVRARMCDVVAIVTHRGELARDEAARFLRACYSDIQPQDECYVWEGWQRTIAALGLVELRPMVEQAFARGLISPYWTQLKHFDEDLQQVIDDPIGLPDRWRGEFDLFGDVIEELSGWLRFKPEDREKSDWDSSWRLRSPVTNPLRSVGRNDPCPCGSGKKFKKCCLNAQPAQTVLRAAS